MLAWIAIAAGSLLGYGIPDLDIRLLGIGYHRYFLFHSAFLPILLAIYTPKALRTLAAGIALGLGCHLFTDLFQYKAVIFPFIGSLVKGTSLDDRLWEGANAAACWLVFLRLRRD